MLLSCHHRRSAAQRGSFLVEAMVASLLILVGIVGTMQMQANMARSSVDTNIRMQAGLLATSLISTAAMQPIAATCLEVPAVDGCAYPAMSTELTNWRAQYTAMMPAVSGTDTTPLVTFNTSKNMISVVIRWQVKGDNVVNSLTYMSGL
jgi:Tfp pilus assembly protein PilV